MFRNYWNSFSSLFGVREEFTTLTFILAFLKNESIWFTFYRLMLFKWLFHKSAMLIYESSTMLPKIQVVSMPIHFTESYILLTEILEENSRILNRLFKIQQTSVISNSKGTRDFVRNSECLKYRSFRNLT